jgi:hypothetical protein
VGGFIPIICFRFDSVFSTVIDGALAHMQNFLLEFGREKTHWFDAAGFTGRFDCRFRWCPLGELVGMRTLTGGHYTFKNEFLLMALNLYFSKACQLSAINSMLTYSDITPEGPCHVGKGKGGNGI